MPSSDVAVTLQDIVNVRQVISKVATLTPVFTSRTLSNKVEGTIALKAENLQRTGSFKVRGATAKLAALTTEQRKRGVVAASAGNHGQAVAAAAAAHGIPCEVYVPQDASLSKIEAAIDHGAIIHQHGVILDESLTAARQRAAETGMSFIHPFDDPAVICGQGTIGLELLEQVPDVSKVVLAIGGGGLASGVAVALKESKPNIEIIGVQAEMCAPFMRSLVDGRPVRIDPGATIADGIAVKQPSGMTLDMISKYLDDVVVVSEAQIAEAMMFLIQRCKLLVEGAGAVPVAALIAGVIKPARDGTTVPVLSGGNVDVSSIAVIGRLHETNAGRRLILLAKIPDRPGGLAKLLDCIAAARANVIELHHVREGIDLTLRETAVELTLETRGPAHAESVIRALETGGFASKLIH